MSRKWACSSHVFFSQGSTKVLLELEFGDTSCDSTCLWKVKSLHLGNTTLGSGLDLAFSDTNSTQSNFLCVKAGNSFISQPNVLIKSLDSLRLEPVWPALFRSCFDSYQVSSQAFDIYLRNLFNWNLSERSEFWSINVGISSSVAPFVFLLNPHAICCTSVRLSINWVWALNGSCISPLDDTISHFSSFTFDTC